MKSSLLKILSCLIITQSIVLAGKMSIRDKDSINWFDHYYKSIKYCTSVKTHKSLFLSGVVLIPVSFLLDDYMQDYASTKGFYPDRISQIGDIFGYRMGYYAGIAAIGITGMTKHQKLPKTLAQMQLVAESVLTSAAVTELIKKISGRQRPNGNGDKSFPSGHTSGSFALAAGFHEIYGNKIGTAAYVLAAFVGSSRINDNKHYLSDVVTGALIGTIIGRSFAKQYRYEWSVAQTNLSPCTTFNISFSI